MRDSNEQQDKPFVVAARRGSFGQGRDGWRESTYRARERGEAGGGGKGRGRNMRHAKGEAKGGRDFGRPSYPGPMPAGGGAAPSGKGGCPSGAVRLKYTGGFARAADARQQRAATGARGTWGLRERSGRHSRGYRDRHQGSKQPTITSTYDGLNPACRQDITKIDG
jgi:hypothetical protein